MSDCFITRRGGSSSPAGDLQLHSSTRVEYNVSEDKLVVTDSWENGSFTDTVSIYINDTFLGNANVSNLTAEYSTTAIEENDIAKIVNHGTSFIDSTPYTQQLTSEYFLGFGDGHLNMTTNGYNGLIVVNGSRVTMSSAYSYFSGNLNKCDIATLFANNPAGYTSFQTPLFEPTTGNWGTSQTSPAQDCYQAWMRGYSGENTYPLMTVPNTASRKTVFFEVGGGYWTSSQSLSGVKFAVDNDPTSYYTLQDLITREVIEPLVLAYSGADNGPYRFSDVLNIITGGYCGSNSYPTSHCIFILKPNHNIIDCKMSLGSSTATAYPDGIGFTWFNYNIFKIVYREQTDTIAQLRQACVETNYCRLSTAIGDKATGDYGSRYFERNTAEPVIMTIGFSGGTSSSSSNYVTYILISKSNTLTGTASEYGTLRNPVPYTTSSNKTVYIYAMESQVQTMFNTNAGATVNSTSTDFGYNNVYYFTDNNTFIGSASSDMEALINRLYNLS